MGGGDGRSRKDKQTPALSGIIKDTLVFGLWGLNVWS